MGVADGGHAEGGRPVVEVARAAGLAVAEILLTEERRVTGGTGDHAVEVAAELEVRGQAVENGGEAGQPSLEVLLEVVVHRTETRVGVAGVKGIVCVGHEVGEDTEVLGDAGHRLAAADHGDGGSRLLLDALAQFALPREDEVVMQLGPFVALRPLQAERELRLEALQDELQIGRRQLAAALRDPHVGGTGPGVGGEGG